MAKEAVAKTRRNRMDQQRTPRKSGESNLRSMQSQSLLNVNELETRAKATVKDINDLYVALQGLVPKKSPHNSRQETGKNKARRAASGTDTDTARSSEEWDLPRLRRYHSEKYPKKLLRDTNMNFVTTPRKPVWEKPVQEKQVLEKTFSDERQIVSDTEVELNNYETNKHKQLERHRSLPTYDEGEESVKNVDETDGGTKRSKFSIFRRHRRSKTGKKKASSWRSFFSTLSLKRGKTKKHGKNKIGQATITKPSQNDSLRTPKHLTKTGSGPTKTGSGPTKERTPKSTPRSSFDVGSNSLVRKSGRKRMAPEPPVETPSGGNTSFQQETFEPRERLDTFGTKSDMVQKKFTAWYKQAVKETNSSLLKEPLRATRSHENLLTDTEIIRKRNAFSSDTDSFSGGDRNRIRQNVPRTKVRKTRAKRNRRRERARFHSCPNVKLVTKALDEAEKKDSRVPAVLNPNTKNDCTDNVSQTNHTCITTVKPVEAKLSFGSSLDNDEAGIDSVKVQNAHARNWITRQCSKTTIGCIRPLQLNLFYSESPSRETVHRSRSMVHRPRGEQPGAGNPQDFAFKIRRSSSRRRKRRSFKRTRLPHQSPFYVPPATVTPKDQPEKNCFTVSKDSGLGSPETSYDKRFSTFPNMKRDQRLAKRHSESEDSGWASSYRHFTNTSETGIQTDPVIVRPVLPHVISDDNSQSEA